MDTRIFITSPAITLKDNMLFVSPTHEACAKQAENLGLDISNHIRGFLGTDGLFYDAGKAAMIAYKYRQILQFRSVLKDTDLFIS